MVVLLTSCAIITINVNFPAQEVRKAYDNLEDELLKEPPPPPDGAGTGKDTGGMGEGGEGTKGGEGTNGGAVEGSGGGARVTEPETQLETALDPFPSTTVRLRKITHLLEVLNLDLTTPALAQEGRSSTITALMRKMPEVVQAYKRRSARLRAVRAMLTAGKVGEGNAGLLVERGSLTPAESALLKAENADRRAVIDGMARSIVQINKMPESESNINEVYPKAAMEFAATRRGKAKSGWSIQLPNGRWMRKGG